MERVSYTRDNIGEPRKSGTQAVVGAVLAVVGVLAAANPSNLLLRAISEAAPQLAAAVPTVITACGAIVAALSQPPALTRKRSE